MLEQKVTSLELSKRMKALGAKQESEKYWRKESYRKAYSICDCYDDCIHTGKSLSAFDPSELGEMLPPAIEVDGYDNPLLLAIFKSGLSYSVQFLDTDKNERVFWRDGVSMAEAMGEMWCYLKENKLI